MPETAAPLADSVPLHELTGSAPGWRLRRGEAPEPDYPISNDESAAYFDQVRARTLLPEYREASNRTAVLVGESALMAALRFIPEETIVVLDRSADMCEYMSQYIDALRQAETRDEWGQAMGMLDRRVCSSDFGRRARDRMAHQVHEWDDTGYLHPIMSDEAYTEARGLAHQKAIIPWYGDLTSYEDMRELGDALRTHDAHVTLLNLTNSIAYSHIFRNAGEYVRRLAELPVTPNAPILTTAVTPKLGPDLFVKSTIVEATGPFFGLENLRKHGGRTQGGDLGSVSKRQIEGAEDLPGHPGDGLGVLLASLLDRLDGRFVDAGPRRPGEAKVFFLSPDGREEVDVAELPPDIREALRDIEL